MKVLIVDDSSAMRMIVLRTLRQAGFGGHDFEQAADGAAALEFLDANDVDIVLADWNMPKMTGIELLEALREKGNAVKFGFITTEATAEMRGRAGDAGANFLIAKPFTVEAFQAALTPFFGGGS